MPTPCATCPRKSNTVHPFCDECWPRLPVYLREALRDFYKRDKARYAKAVEEAKGVIK